MTTPYWNSFTAKNFADAYRLLCHGVLNGDKVGNTRELRNMQFTIEDISTSHLSTRNASVRYMLGELVWYLAGSRDVNFIAQFAPYWRKITDNGITSNSAYGYLIKRRYAFDQLWKVVDLLKTDPESRRGVINLNYANEKVIITKDEPCTIALQFYIRDGKVHCTGMMRSNDIWRGLPYDIVYFTLLQTIIANSLNLDTGSYTHFATSLHMYESDAEKIRRCVDTDAEINEYTLDRMALFADARFLYDTVDNDSIVQICKRRGIVKFTGDK